MPERPYTDLDYWEDLETVRDMERSIESSTALLRTVKWKIESDTYILDRARERLAAHPEFGDA